VVDAIAVNQIPDRTFKLRRLGFLSPLTFGRQPRQWIGRSRTMLSLKESLETTPDLRQHWMPLRLEQSPRAYDPMDGYQSMLATAAYAERHPSKFLK
jgi:hypothetical protein